MSDIETLRKSLAVPSEGLASEDKKAMAIDAITRILDALEQGVGTFGEWEQRCLAASIIALQRGPRPRPPTSAPCKNPSARPKRPLWPRPSARPATTASAQP